MHRKEVPFPFKAGIFAHIWTSEGGVLPLFGCHRIISFYVPGEGKDVLIISYVGKTLAAYAGRSYLVYPMVYIGSSTEYFCTTNFHQFSARLFTELFNHFFNLLFHRVTMHSAIPIGLENQSGSHLLTIIIPPTQLFIIPNHTPSHKGFLSIL